MDVVLYIALACVFSSGAAILYRIILGPTDADRAIAADMLLVVCITLFCLFGMYYDFTSVLDVLLISSGAGFLSSLALARLISRDEQ